MITFFFGTDRGRIREAVDQAVAVFSSSYPEGRAEWFDLTEEEQRERLRIGLKTDSFFSEKKIWLVTGTFSPASKDQDFLTHFSAYQHHPDPERQLVFYEFEGETELRKKYPTWLKWLKEHGQPVKEFASWQGVKLEQWLKNKFQENDLTASPEVLRQLARFDSVERLEGEVAKLVAYKNFRQEKNIIEEDLKKLVVLEEDDNNFALVDALAFRRGPLFLTLLEKRLAGGDDPQAVLGLLVYQFRNLLKIKSLTKEAVPYDRLVVLTGLHPFVVKKTYEQARGFSLEELKGIYRQLSLLEIKFKSGIGGDPHSQLVLMLGEVLWSGPARA